MIPRSRFPSRHPRVFRTLIAVLVLGFALPKAEALPTSTREGLVVTAHPHASRAGATVLAEGGNAVDALVAAAFTLAVVEPHSSGLGGGGFALVYEAESGKVHAIDFREVAPAAADEAYFLQDGTYEPTLSKIGGRAVGVPGAVAGYAYLASKYGTWKLAKLVEPAAKLADKGFVTGAAHKRALQWGGKVLAASPEAAIVFGADDGGDGLGQRLRQPALAAFIRDIGKRGPKALYEGKGAEAVERAVKASGGALTRKDLADYEVRTLKPLEGSYRGHRVVTFPPPSAGGFTVLQTLAGMERHPVEKLSHRSPARLHALIEIWKRSYAARAEFLGDPRVESAVNEHVERLLSKETMDAWVKSIDPKKATPAEEVSSLVRTTAGGEHTTHLVAMDAEGNVALMTSTLNGAFGSGVFVPELGLLLNNQLDDFAAPVGGNLYGLVGGELNAIAPGKTPLSTMAPTLVFRDDKPWIAVGAPGGSTIATTIAQIILNVVDEGMDVQQAVAASRLHAQHRPEVVRFEAYGVEDATRSALERLGHDVQLTSFQWGNASVIVVGEDGVNQGSADPRGEGAAVAQDQLP